MKKSHTGPSTVGRVPRHASAPGRRLFGLNRATRPFNQLFPFRHDRHACDIGGSQEDSRKGNQAVQPPELLQLPSKYLQRQSAAVGAVACRHAVRSAHDDVVVADALRQWLATGSRALVGGRHDRA